MDGVGRERGDGAFAAGFEGRATATRGPPRGYRRGRQGAGGRERDGDRVGPRARPRRRRTRNARARGGGEGRRAAGLWVTAGRVSRRCGDEMERHAADVVDVRRVIWKIALRRGVRRDARRVVRSGPGEEDAARVGRQRPAGASVCAVRRGDVAHVMATRSPRAAGTKSTSARRRRQLTCRSRANARLPPHRDAPRDARGRAPIRCRIPTRRRQSTR